MSRTAAAILDMLGAWVLGARYAPVWAALIGVSAVVAALLAAGSMVRTWLEQRANRIATGPIFALAGIATMALAFAVWVTDALLSALGEQGLGHHAALLLGQEAEVRERLHIPTGPIVLPGPAALPLSVILLALVYLALVIWAGRTLAEMASLEQKPDDILAKERAEHQKAIQEALKEGRKMPEAEIVSLPLSDDLFGRTYKLLGHWTSVEMVEERFVRWQRPLVLAMVTLLVFSLPGAAGGHLHTALWAGALILLDGLQKNLRTPPKPKEEEKKEPEQKPPPPELLAVRPMIEAVHKSAGPLALAPVEPISGPAQISPGTELASKRVLEDMLRELGMGAGLYVHQGLACDAFAQRRNVLLTTPPLSGKRTLLDLLVFYTLLVDSETVLYLAPDAEEARRAEERFRKRAADAKWQWNIHAARIAGSAGAVDPGRAQPGLVFADPEAVHRDLCGQQDDWGAYLGTLGLIVVPELDRHHGPRGAHLAHLLRRLRRAARRASPALPPNANGERLRFVATATPLFRDLGRFAERIVGRPFLVLGPEVDGAPHPDGVSYVLPARTAASDLHPAVHALGEALGVGLSAELFGYDEILAASDVTRANEIMIGRGVATRGRSFADPSVRGNDALSSAQVVVARASAARWAALPLLTSHVGQKVGRFPKAKRVALGKGESVGSGAARKDEPPEEIPIETTEEAPAALTDEQIAAANLEQKIVHFFQPDLEPFAALLVKERPVPSHVDLGHGCTLVVDPSSRNVQIAHIRAALAEAEHTEEELAVDFSHALVKETLAALRAEGSRPALSAKDDPRTLVPARLVERSRRVIDPSTGEARVEKTYRLSTGASGEAPALGAGDAARVVDRPTGDVLFEVERERALAAAYPGRVFVRQKKRFSVLPLEEQDGLDAGRVACEREERAITTSRMRRVEVTLLERRTGDDRRATSTPPKDDARARTRRAEALRTLGGASFALRHVPVTVREETFGFRRFDPNGLVRDTTLYADPIACAYTTRAAVLGLPAASFGAIDAASLHALTHLFRTTLPAFLHHGEEDIEITWIQAFSRGDGEAEPSIAFVDAHPDGAGFADAITLDVLRACVRWSLALTRRCPGGCTRRAGCLFCLQIRDCHSDPDGALDLDKAGADRVLAALVGEAEALKFGAAPKSP
ncbi:MAG: Zn-binding domain-containing protein [Polyangiaceae bacterium]